jgi:hypothetical protein
VVASVWTGPTIIATTLGGLGFVVAALSLGWQIRTAVIERQTRVRIALSRARLWPTGGVKDELLVFTAVNESSHPVRITKVGIDFEGHAVPGMSSFWGWEQPPGTTIPGLVAARDSGLATTVLRVGDRYVAGIEPDGKIRGYVYTGDGSRFESDWIRPDSLPWASHLVQFPLAESAMVLLDHLKKQEQSPTEQ